MTKAQVQKLRPNVGLIAQIDSFSQGLLDTVASGSVEDRMQVLGAVTKWIGVRHKLQESEGEDGSGLASYRSAIASPAAERAATRSRASATSRGILGSGNGDEIGADLAALQRSLPTADAGHTGHDIQDTLSQIRSAAGGLRGLHVGIPGRKLPGRDENGGARDLQSDGTAAVGVADGDEKLGDDNGDVT